MLNLICKGVATIISTGLNSTSLILPFCILLYVVWGQVDDVGMVFKEVFGKEV